MTLRQKQSLFVECLTKLLTFGHSRGYEFTLGEAGVTNPRKARGLVKVDDGWMPAKVVDGEHMRGSLHYKRLAIDLNLFVDGRYITSSTHPAYVELGTYWESLHELCTWGGRFSDANHFSVTHGGRK